MRNASITEANIRCSCGKKAIGLVAGEGWLCRECYEKKASGKKGISG